MTSLKPPAAFADLSPEQRQALFDKLRQRKLSQARRPLEEPQAAPDTRVLSPAQQACLAVLTPDTPNRLLELVLTGLLPASDLRTAWAQLVERHSGLHIRFTADPPGFDTSTAAPLHLETVAGDPEASLQTLRAQLQRPDAPALQLACLHHRDARHDSATTYLLLAAHPLLLDAHSLLQLAAQLLTLVSDPAAIETIQPATPEALNRFAGWSRQLLEQKLLDQEWSRLQPKSLAEGARTRPAAGARVQHHSVLLDSDTFSGRPADGSVKNWLGAALHRCLGAWLSHQDVLYWFSAPELRDETFEALPGFFPYFVPVLSSDGERDTLTFSQRQSRLHTRFASVSEQLSEALCRHGSATPLIHYHWFDPGSDTRVTRVVQHQPGLLLAPLEIHLTELLDGVCLDVHFDTAQIGLDQVQFLLRDLLGYLREQPDSNSTSRPDLHEQLRRIWQELLQKSPIGNDQSFFELGGHSLQVTELKFRIRQQLKLDLPISVLYELTTINKLASFILATQGGSLGWQRSDTDASAEEEEEGVL